MKKKIYCHVPPLQGLLVFNGMTTVVEGLDAWFCHNANEASNLCELVMQGELVTQDLNT